MNIQDRVAIAHRTLTNTVKMLDLGHLSIRVPVDQFEAMLVLFDCHSVSIGTYSHRSGRFMQFPAQRIGECFVAVSTDEVSEEFPADITAGAVVWGKCPHCDDGAFVYGPNMEAARFARAVLGITELDVLAPEDRW